MQFTKGLPDGSRRIKNYETNYPDTLANTPQPNTSEHGCSEVFSLGLDRLEFSGGSDWIENSNPHSKWVTFTFFNEPLL